MLVQDIIVTKGLAGGTNECCRGHWISTHPDMSVSPQTLREDSEQEAEEVHILFLFSPGTWIVEFFLT